MNTYPLKSGWYWVRRNTLGPVPEVCFWTGRRFLSIHASDRVLLPSDLTWHSDDPLEVPPEFFEIPDAAMLNYREEDAARRQ